MERKVITIKTQRSLHPQLDNQSLVFANVRAAVTCDWLAQHFTQLMS